jgi:hypothetical protein
MSAATSTFTSTSTSSSSRHVSKMVVKYANGSIYEGQGTRDGQRSGFGTLRTPIYLYGVLDSNNPSSIVNWMEYVGEWRDNIPSGLGTIKKYRGNMTPKVIYQGEWVNGEPVNDP